MTENGCLTGTLAPLDLAVATWQNTENHAAATFYPANREDFRNFEVRLRIHLDKKKAD